MNRFALNRLTKEPYKKCEHLLTVEYSTGYHKAWLFQKCIQCGKVIGRWKDYYEWSNIYIKD